MNNFLLSWKHWNPLPAPPVPSILWITSCGLCKSIKHASMRLMIRGIFWKMALVPWRTGTLELLEWIELYCMWFGNVYYTWIALYCMLWHGLLFEHCRDMYIKMNRGVWYCILHVVVYIRTLVWCSDVCCCTLGLSVNKMNHHLYICVGAKTDDTAYES